ncbi:MAG: hypothetical protein AAGB34_07705 [Planctomycetota bacterium]
MSSITPAQHAKFCKRRFGTKNPERMDNPVWEWMVHRGHNPYVARIELGLQTDFDGRPDWCFDRMGSAKIEMPDGRSIFIAGEHEDYYDPDFCIYNDVIVRNRDHVEIYGYPADIFPPTDFHTATLVGQQIILIGRLGYQDERGGMNTPVFFLDTSSYEIRSLVCSGDSPGWLYKHNAVLSEDGRIEVSGGAVQVGEGKKEQHRDNFDTYSLDIEKKRWHKLTDNSHWRQFLMSYEWSEQDDTDLGWYTGEILKKLGYPVRPFQDSETEEDDEETYPDRWHEIDVDGVQVACMDGFEEIRVVVQGELPKRVLKDLLRDIKTLAQQSSIKIKAVTER